MPELVYSTTTPSVRHGLCASSREIVLSDSVSVLLEPEDGHVTIGRHRLKAYKICDDMEPNGRVGSFTIECPRWTYDIYLYEGYVEIVKWVTHIDLECPVYGGDVREIHRFGGFMKFVLDELIPEYQDAGT
jgi:hypothetical protein